MDKRRFFIFAVYVGILSFLLQLADRLISPSLPVSGNTGYVFLAFQGWALYFLLGSGLKGAVKGICGYGMGIFFAILMAKTAGFFSGGLKMFANPAAALLIVPVMMYFEFAPWFISVVSVFFIGAGAFYGIYGYVEGITMPEAAGIVLLYCLLGMICGALTVRFRRWYEGVVG